MDIQSFEIVTKDNNRRKHLTWAFNLAELDGHILEFGVFKGGTINHLATLTNQVIHGFDSFESLPEPWYWGNGRVVTDKFKVNKIPDVADNVFLHKGWFKDTLPKWKRHYGSQIKFLHIDSDLYSSCKTVLTELNDYIVPGTIIVFDELFNYPNWKQGEYKALKQWLRKYKREVLPLGRTAKYAASVKVIK